MICRNRHEKAVPSGGNAWGGPAGRPNKNNKYTPIIWGKERNVNNEHLVRPGGKKTESGKKAGKYDRYAAVMKERVCETLDIFCRQDGEFAQAVVQGGSFEDCMKDVSAEAKNYGNNGIPDLEAFRRAVRFYFPGADVKFHMTINLCADVESGEPEAEPKARPKTLRMINLDDYL